MCWASSITCSDATRKSAESPSPWSRKVLAHLSGETNATLVTISHKIYKLLQERADGEALSYGPGRQGGFTVSSMQIQSAKTLTVCETRHLEQTQER